MGMVIILMLMPLIGQLAKSIAASHEISPLTALKLEYLHLQLVVIVSLLGLNSLSKPR